MKLATSLRHPGSRRLCTSTRHQLPHSTSYPDSNSPTTLQAADARYPGNPGCRRATCRAAFELYEGKPGGLQRLPRVSTIGQTRALDFVMFIIIEIFRPVTARHCLRLQADQRNRIQGCYEQSCE